MKNYGALTILPLVLFASQSVAQDKAPATDWLIGTWTLCDDPDQSPKDSLQFNQDGSGLLIREKGNLELVHKHTDQTVYILANANGNAIPIQLSASAEHDKLLLHSEKSGSTSSYVRTDGPLVAHCSIK